MPISRPAVNLPSPLAAPLFAQPAQNTPSLTVFQAVGRISGFHSAQVSGPSAELLRKLDFVSS